MTQSNETKQLTSALLVFQMKVEPIQKDSVNPYFKSKYATLSGILKAIKQPLIESELVLTQFPTGENGLTTRLMHVSGEWLEETYKMTPAKNDPQGSGSALTYMRRYAIGAILGLDIDEDDDANSATHVSKPTPKYAATYKPSVVPEDAQTTQHESWKDAIENRYNTDTELMKAIQQLKVAKGLSKEEREELHNLAMDKLNSLLPQ
jgi:hypothetical protein